MTTQELDSFRHELQTERLEMQRIITAEFDKLGDKFDKHVEAEQLRLAALDTRVTVIESKAANASRMVWTLVVAFTGTLFTYLFSYFKPQS